MHLTLFVPDLLWPDIDDTAAFEIPGTAALTRVLAAAARTESTLSPTGSWESCLAALFGFDGLHPPLAQCRAGGDSLGDLPADCRLLCADPVNLDFVQQSLILSPIPADTLAPGDMTALIASLNEEFRTEGRFVSADAPAPINHAYFIPADNGTVFPDLAATSRLAGRRIDADQTRQILDRQSLQWLNRIQMCLNDHPVNAARDAKGLPRINSLWPWGTGALTTTPPARFSSAAGTGAMLRGLCLSTGTPWQPQLQFPATAGHHLMAEFTPSDSVFNDDIPAWQNALRDLDRTWVTPALNALTDKNGCVTSLRIISPDAHRVREWTLDRSRLQKQRQWWQRWLGIQPAPPGLGELVRSW